MDFVDGALPNSYAVVIPVEKFTHYALNPQRQKDKAVAFEKALGYTLDNYHHLIANIRSNIAKYPATPKPDLGFGQRYEVRMDLLGENGKSAKVITAWIMDKETNETRLGSAYVDKE